MFRGSLAPSVVALRERVRCGEAEAKQGKAEPHGRQRRIFWLAAWPWNLSQTNEPVPSPPNTKQPAARSGNFAQIARHGFVDRSLSPVFEPATRRRRIHAWRLGRPASVPPRVQKHVAERVMDLPRRSKQHGVVSIGEYGAMPREHTVHGASQSGADRFHPGGQRPPSAGLDDQVHMVRHERVVDDAERALLTSFPKRATELPHEGPRS